MIGIDYDSFMILNVMASHYIKNNTNQHVSIFDGNAVSLSTRTSNSSLNFTTLFANLTQVLKLSPLCDSTTVASLNRNKIEIKRGIATNMYKLDVLIIGQREANQDSTKFFVYHTELHATDRHPQVQPVELT